MSVLLFETIKNSLLIFQFENINVLPSSTSSSYVGCSSSSRNVHQPITTTTTVNHSHTCIRNNNTNYNYTTTTTATIPMMILKLYETAMERTYELMVVPTMTALRLENIQLDRLVRYPEGTTTGGSMIVTTIFLQKMNQIFHPMYVLTLLLISFATIPLVGYIYLYCSREKKYIVPYTTTSFYQVAHQISQMGRVVTFVHIMNCFITMFVFITTTLSSTTSDLNSSVGLLNNNKNSRGGVPNNNNHQQQQQPGTNMNDEVPVVIQNLSKVLSKFIYIVWLTQRVCELKKYLLCKVVNLYYTHKSNTISTNMNTTSVSSTSSSFSKRNRLSRITMLDRLLNYIIYVVTILIILNILDIELGISSTSMFTMGSIGTIVLGLISRDLTTMFVNGFTLTLSNRIAEGDDIKFGDGTSGVIESIGWIQTTIRNYDNIVEIIPNSELGKQRIRNISRTNQCRVQQVLRFHYEDALKLPKILDDIIDEIKISCCPDVIVDGSKPLRAVWTEYCDTHLKVLVTAHFHNIKPIGKKFCNIRQKCLLAIYRAVVVRNQTQFVTCIPFMERSSSSSGMGSKQQQSSSSSGTTSNTDDYELSR